MTTQTDLAPQPAATATALPARFYVDAAMADLDRHALFDRDWAQPGIRSSPILRACR